MSFLSRVKSGIKKNKNTLFDFDNKDLGFVEKTFVVLSSLILMLAWVFFVVSFLTKLFSAEPVFKHSFTFWQPLVNGISGKEFYHVFYFYIQSSVISVVFLAVFFAPLLEEFAFRYIWLKNRLRERDEQQYLFPKLVKKLGERSIWTTVGITSIIFGFAHGGAVNILIQGVGGVFLSYVFLRNNRSYWSAVWLHALYNAIIIWLVKSGLGKNMIIAII